MTACNWLGNGDRADALRLSGFRRARLRDYGLCFKFALGYFHAMVTCISIQRLQSQCNVNNNYPQHRGDAIS